MQKAEERIMQEEELAQTYLHPSTKPEVITFYLFLVYLLACPSV
jgi:hypothetical protein